MQKAEELLNQLRINVYREMMCDPRTVSEKSYEIMKRKPYHTSNGKNLLNTSIKPNK